MRRLFWPLIGQTVILVVCGPVGPVSRRLTGVGVTHMIGSKYLDYQPMAVREIQGITAEFQPVDHLDHATGPRILRLNLSPREAQASHIESQDQAECDS